MKKIAGYMSMSNLKTIRALYLSALFVMGFVILGAYLLIASVLELHEINSVFGLTIQPPSDIHQISDIHQTIERSVAYVLVGVLISLMLIWRFIFRPMEGIIERKTRKLEAEIARRQADEAELRRMHDELDRFFSLSLDLLTIADTDGNFRRVNKEWEYALGYTLEELQGHQFLDFVHPDDRQATLDAMSTLNAQQLLLNFTNRYRHKDGSYRFIEWRSRPDGKLIYAAARDITKRKTIEQALAESEARYRALITSLSEGVVLQDRDSTILTSNAAAERILGLTADQMMGRTSIDPIWRAIREDGSPFPGETHPVPMVLKTGRPVSNVVMGVRKPDNSLTWILINAQPVFMPGADDFMYAVATFSDITALRAASQESLKIQIERERAELLANFITNTSHEIRTPLSVINSGVYLLLKLQDPDRRQQKADQITNQVRLLDRMVTQLQDMAKLNQIRELALAPLSPSQVLHRFVTYHSIKRDGVTVQTVPYEGSIPELMGNMDYIQLALDYLVDNAVRYSPAGDCVLLYAVHQAGEICLCVEDHGGGIPAGHRDLIFEQFYKVDVSRTQNDSAAGMGLSMVRRIMELHGGRVSVTSDPGHKTVFTLSFTSSVTGVSG